MYDIIMTSQNDMVICALSSDFKGIGYGKSSPWLPLMTGHFSSLEHGHANKKDVYQQPSQILASYEYISRLHSYELNRNQLSGLPSLTLPR